MLLYLLSGTGRSSSFKGCNTEGFVTPLTTLRQGLVAWNPQAQTAAVSVTKLTQKMSDLYLLRFDFVLVFW